MAAHVVTGLHEVIERDIPWEQLEAALHYRCWTELLELDDYMDLAKHVYAQDREGLKHEARKLLIKYQAEWQTLGEPRTMEEWVQAKYGV